MIDDSDLIGSMRSYDDKVVTHKSGHFKFVVGISPEVDHLLLRAQDAHDRYYEAAASFPSLAKEQAKFFRVSSIYSTNTIEGGTLTEDETEQIVSRGSHEVTKEQEELRVLNLLKAYEYIDQLLLNNKIAKKVLDLNDIKELHKLVTEGLAHEQNTPGIYRDNKPGAPTRVGLTGYRPPKCLDDIITLMNSYRAFWQLLVESGVHPLYVAPLIHFYYELIHPFFDGNGRVGRIIEVYALQSSGYHIVPYKVNDYYLANQETYFKLFDECRLAIKNGEPYPLTPFIKFFLEGFLVTVNRCQASLILKLKERGQQDHEDAAVANKKINSRQAIILKLIRSREESDRNRRSIINSVDFKALYKNTRMYDRDIKKLVELGFMEISEDNQYVIAY
ncbi:Fic family protein [Piscirickettsia litoralis]|uniref:Fido domain-containing protein n=1 Tax=Piscirickettsia litoralis TaxID=1891921 RepID=A0ABX2ZXR5_9GAMM|nr:Fic family protein [Piscirickettsia litoralis]ODN41396.1 hypothetical protein BGC07_16645 [Piscirickettsia litoralis]